MAKKKTLGKGLDEIFGQDIGSFIEDISNGDSGVGKNIKELPIKEIRTNPYQPRKEFDESGLNELASSIKENGVFQPVIVRKATAGYELAAGERRLRASKIAGLKNIPAIIVDYNDQQMMEIALLENIQRKDLTPIEQANAYNQLINKLGYTQDQLAKRLGKSRSNVTNLLRLLNLPSEVQKLVNNGKLSYGHARTLLSLSDEDKMIRLAKQCIAEDLSVRQLEKMCTPATRSSKPVSRNKKDMFVEDVEKTLAKKFGTKVEIQNKSIIIKYNNTEDLNRILEIMNVIED